MLVFCQTKRVCDRVATQPRRSRRRRRRRCTATCSRAPASGSLRKFAEGKLSILVATDVAARGIDIDDIGAVIHYEPAKDVKDYLHRSGRTARAGQDGWAVTLVEYNQHTQMRILQRGMRLPTDKPVEVFSNDSAAVEPPRVRDGVTAVAAQNMPAAEIDIDDDLVRAFSPSSSPTSPTLPLTLVANGWDNAIFRLGDDLAVRMPRRQLGADLVAHEQRWLPDLASRLPLPIPAPLRVGLPSGDYPWTWSVVAWFDGDVAADVALVDPWSRRDGSASSSPRCTSRRPPMRRTTRSVGSRSPSFVHASWTASNGSAARSTQARSPRASIVSPTSPSGTVPRCGCTATCTRRTWSFATGRSAR